MVKVKRSYLNDSDIQDSRNLLQNKLWSCVENVLAFPEVLRAIDEGIEKLQNELKKNPKNDQTKKQLEVELANKVEQGKNLDKYLHYIEYYQNRIKQTDIVLESKKDLEVEVGNVKKCK